MAKQKKLNRGLIVCMAICVICVAVLVASKMGQSQQEPQQEQEPASPPSATYQVDSPFELTGTQPAIDDQGNKVHVSWNFSENWDWLGTMRFTVSQPVLYDSAEEAGFEARSDANTNAHVLAVDITVENIDATCRESVIKENGAPSFNMNMFVLQGASGFRTIESYYFSAPVVDGLIWGDGKSLSYTWVELGQTETIRIGYIAYLKGDETPKSRTGVDTVPEDYRISLDDEYKMTLFTGWADAAPIVELGKAKVAEAPYAKD